MTTNYRDDLGTARADQQGGSADGAKEQAKQAASTAADQGSQVAGTARDEASRVASEATSQLRGLLDQATSQVEEQSAEQKSRLASTVRTFADDLDSMRNDAQSSGLAAEVLQRVSEQAKDLAGRLEAQEPRELLEDVRRFARRRPGTFVLGALAAGVVAGRLTRGAKEARRGTNTQLDTGTGTSARTGLDTRLETGLDSPTGIATGTDTGTDTGTTIGTPGPAPGAGTRASSRTAPIPPTDDDASPAYLSDGSDAGPSYLGTEQDVTAPGSTSGPGTGRS